MKFVATIILVCNIFFGVSYNSSQSGKQTISCYTVKSQVRQQSPFPEPYNKEIVIACNSLNTIEEINETNQLRDTSSFSRVFFWSRLLNIQNNTLQTLFCKHSKSLNFVSQLMLKINIITTVLLT